MTIRNKFFFHSTLREVRFHFCPTSEHSARLRSFLTKEYAAIKYRNPKTPVLLREATGTRPKVWARYASRVERSVALDGLANDEVLATTISELVKSGPNQS